MPGDAILVTHVARRQHPLLPRHIEDTTAPWRVVAHVDVSPPSRESFDRFDEEYPWRAAAQLQEERYQEICAAMAESPDARVIYMGFVPIPLALHLGSLFGQAVDVAIFQHHHDNLNWRWTSDEATSELLAPPVLARARSGFDGDVLLRVASSYPIAVEDTRWISEDTLPEYELSLVEPMPDGIRSPVDLAQFGAAFRHMLDAVRTNFPSSRCRHLAAAVPVGVAFSMGQQINPTRHLPIQTWQFLGSRRRRFARALCLGEFTDLPRALVLAASPVDREAIAAADEVQEIGELLAKYPDRVDALQKPAVRGPTLGSLLEEFQPSVLHIACHGEMDWERETTVLRLSKAGGWSCTVETEDFLRLLERCNSLRCVMLMACESATLAHQVARRISTAIGWKGRPGERDISEFARTFWQSLLDGHSVDEAFRDGRLALGGARTQVQLEVADGVDATKVIPIPKL